MSRFLYDEFQIDELVTMGRIFDDMMKFDRKNITMPDLTSGADLVTMEWGDRIEMICEFYRFREGSYT